MRLNVLSYNLEFHKAYIEVPGLVTKYQPDVVCLQECLTDQLKQTIGSLHLVGATLRGRQGMAIYAHRDRFHDDWNADPIDLVLSPVERALRTERTRLLIAKLTDRETGHHIYPASFHATHHIATNGVRNRQVAASLQRLNKLDEAAPAILIGDYNYPFSRHNLLPFVERAGFEMVLPEQPTCHIKHGPFTTILDFACSRGLSNAHIEVLPFGISDHAPILAKFEIDSLV